MQWRRWTVPEDAQLRERYGKELTDSLARSISRTKVAVQCRASDLHIRSSSRKWSPEREALLRKKYGAVPTESLAHELGISLPALYSHASLLELTRPTMRKGIAKAWISSEDSFLRRNYGVIRPAEIAAKLGRSRPSIYHRSIQLHLSSPLGSSEFFKRQTLPRSASPFTGTTDSAILGFVAGIIDGEGSITMPPKLAIAVSTTTKALALHLRSVVGGSVAGPYRYNKTKVFGTKRCRVKPQYRWNFSSRYHTYLLLQAVLPYLVIKQQTAKKAITYLERKYGWNSL